MKLWSTKRKKSAHEKTEKGKFNMGKNQLVILSAIAAVLVAMAVALAVYTFTYDKAFVNVTVGDERVGGKTQAEIAQLLSEKGAGEYDSVEFDIKINDNVTHVTASELKAGRDWETAASQAMSVGRGGSVLGRMWRVFTCFFVKHDISPSALLDEAAVNELIAKIAEQNNIAPVHAAYSVDTDKAVMTLTPPKDGVKVNEEELRAQIRSRFDTSSYEDVVMTTEVDAATVLDMDAVYSAVHAEVKDATMTVEGEQHKIVPHVIGVDFDLAFAKEKLAASPDKTVEIPLAITRPKTTTIMLEATLFEDTLSSVTTYYSPKKVTRTHNVALAAKLINGTVLNPGEVFSYNKTVGPRTAARGFKEAAIFSKGEVVDGLGGGICQVSSTLYMATMKADLETVSRKNHSFYVDYAPKGQDATVVYGSIDFQFRNNSPYPIKIVAVQRNNYITVTIKGTKTEEKTVKITTKTLSTTPFNEKTVVDNTLKPGERVIEQKGQQGMTMDVYRNVYDAKGKLIRSEYENKTKYVPMTQIVRVGPAATGAVATPPAQTAPTTPSTQTPAETPTEPEQAPSQTEPQPEQQPDAPPAEDTAPEQSEDAGQTSSDAAQPSDNADTAQDAPVE